MIKVTLPNGTIVEGDSATEVTDVIDLLHADPADDKLAKVIELPKDISKDPGAPAMPPKLKSSTTYPHKVSDAKCGMKIGSREEQVLRAAKVIAEVNENRATEFTSFEVAELAGTSRSYASSALNGLARKGLIAHGSHRKLWLVTRKGWDTGSLSPFAQVDDSFHHTLS